MNNPVGKDNDEIIRFDLETAFANLPSSDHPRGPRQFQTLPPAHDDCGRIVEFDQISSSIVIDLNDRKGRVSDSPLLALRQRRRNRIDSLLQR